jgi:hypothetical protein
MTLKARFLAAAGAVAILAPLAVAGCGLLQAAKSPRVALFECQANALRPVLGEVLDVEALLRDFYVGKADLGAALRNTKATEAEVQELLTALQACDAPPPAPDAGSTTQS